MAFIANYTVRDITASALGCLLFLSFLLTPGYVAAWLTNVFGFRTLTPPWKLLVSLPASVALSPILTYWAGGAYFGHAGSWTPVFAIDGICFLIWLLLLSGMWGHEPLFSWLRGFRRVPRAGWIAAAVWFCIALASLVNLQIHNGLYLSVSDWDHLARAPITDAITRGGVHPSNPFYFLGGPAPLRYHYFWFLLCSLVTQIGSTRSGELIPSQEAIIASIVWCGWSLIALVPLYLRFFQGWTGVRLRRCSLIAIALFAVTGLDIVPTIIGMAAGFQVHPEMEWWNEQVTSWVGSLLWVPHHVAALVSSLMGFLLAWDAALSGAMRRRIAGGILAGAAFATAAGTSIYVTFVFVVFLIVWALATLLRGWRSHTAVLFIAGVTSLVLVAPYLRSLLDPGKGATGTTGGGPSFLALWIRPFWPLKALIAAWQLNSGAAALLNLAALPLNYFLELGFFGVVALLFIRGLRRQQPLPPNTVAALLMAGVSVLICTFVRSGVISANDLGWRGFLPAQFVMLLWGAEFLIRRGERAQAEGKAEGEKFNSSWLHGPAWAPLILILILLGVLGTAYELVLLRTYLIWNDTVIARHTVLAPDDRFGERTLELRHVYETLDSALPPTAKIQPNPAGAYVNFFFGLYANRQTVAIDGLCGAQFGGDPATCPAVFTSIKAIFDGVPNETWDDVEAVCRSLSIDALVITDLDPAWQSDLSWGWQATPAIAGNHVRVYLIGSPRR